MAATVKVVITSRENSDLATIALHEIATNNKLISAAFRNGDKDKELAALDKLIAFADANGITETA